MRMEDISFEEWLRDAKVPREDLSDQHRTVLEAVFHFLQQGEGDYSSCRLAGYFLLHCKVELQVAQIARLVGISRRSAFRHRKLSATEVVQQIQHHFSGRPYGKLLPRHAGPIAEFLFTHPEAHREDLLAFIQRTFEFRVSRAALWEYLKKYGLDRASLEEAHQAASQKEEESRVIALPQPPSQDGLAPAVPDDFFLARPNTQGPSCCGPTCSPGSRRPRNASAMNTARSSEVS
jgi:hypothetical protein